MRGKDPKPDQEVSQQDVNTMNVVTWRRGELSYALIGAPGNVDLKAMGKQIADSGVNDMFQRGWIRTLKVRPLFQRRVHCPLAPTAPEDRIDKTQTRYAIRHRRQQRAFSGGRGGVHRGLDLRCASV